MGMATNTISTAHSVPWRRFRRGQNDQSNIKIVHEPDRGALRRPVIAV